MYSQKPGEKSQLEQAYKYLDEARDISYKVTAVAKTLYIAGESAPDEPGYVDYCGSDYTSLASLCAAKSHQITLLFDSKKAVHDIALEAMALASQIAIVGAMIVEGTPMIQQERKIKTLAGMMAELATEEIALFGQVLS